MAKSLIEPLWGVKNNMKIYLRPVTIEDSPLIVSWRNSPKTRAHCFDKTPLTEESNERFYHLNVETGKYKQFVVERMIEDVGQASYPIATVYLKDMDQVNRRCELCIFTSEDEEWNTESQRIAIEMLLEKAFEEFNMHKVYTYVFADNHDEVQLLQNAGFEKEACLKKEAISLEREYVDIFRMSIIKE